MTAIAADIPAGVWQALADPDAARGDDPVFALDVAPNQSSASLAVAWRRPDGASQVMLAAHGAGVDWVVPQALALTQSWRSRVLVEVTGTAGFLVRPLEQAGVKVETVQRRFHVEACASLDAAVTARQSGTATSQS